MLFFFFKLNPPISHLSKESIMLLIFYKAYLISIFKRQPFSLFLAKQSLYLIALRGRKELVRYLVWSLEEDGNKW